MDEMASPLLVSFRFKVFHADDVSGGKAVLWAALAATYYAGYPTAYSTG